jgi:hypothetical protein
VRQPATLSKMMAPNSDNRENFLAWFTKEFGFTCNAATNLYDVQMIAQALSELDDDGIANACKLVSKDVSQSVAKIAATKLKLACFWVRHQYRTSREIRGTKRPLVKIVYSGEIDRLREQKQKEDQWAAARTEPEYPSLTLDTSTVMKAFDKVKTILGQAHGVTGVPLLYIIRVTLVPPKDDNDDPAFGDEDSKYISIDMEMIACAPILSDEADNSNEDTCILEANGRFVPTFPVDSRKVWSSSWHASASQARGNTSRNTQTSRMDARRGAPSMIISLGGTR